MSEEPASRGAAPSLRLPRLQQRLPIVGSGGYPLPVLLSLLDQWAKAIERAINAKIGAVPVKAAEDLAAGDFVNLFEGDDGAAARLADADAGRAAHGYVLVDVEEGVDATVWQWGINDAVTGQTVGDVYLSDTPGGASATPPTGDGALIQPLGVALTETQILFERLTPVVDSLEDDDKVYPPSRDAVFEALKALVIDSIADGDATHAPSRNAVYDALQAVYTAISTVVVDSIADGDATHAPSRNAVFDALALKAPLASPALTGTPTAPTATAGTSTTQIATTAFAQTAATNAASSVSAISAPYHEVGPISGAGLTYTDWHALPGSDYDVRWLVTGGGGGDGSGDVTAVARSFDFTTNAISRFRVLSSGQVRLVPLAALPTGSKGDLCTLDGDGKLYHHNGTAWTPCY